MEPTRRVAPFVLAKDFAERFAGFSIPRRGAGRREE